MNARTRLRGLAAILALAAVLAGLPALLLGLGADLVPARLPSLEQIRAALTAPDDGTLALAALTVIGWLAWAVLAGSILLEAGSRLRGVRAPRLPGLHLPQGAARQLVTAAALLFAATPTATAAAPALAHAAPATAPATSAPAPADSHAPASRTTALRSAPGAISAAGAPRRYTVRAGDSLSAIAARELGDPGRWHELTRLNPGVAAHPDLIHPGTVLRLPSPHARPGHTYTVRAGDTLSGIAARQLGDPDRWPAIFQASRDTVQPGGTHLSDPDRIDVGQRLTIPAAAPAPRAPARAARTADPIPEPQPVPRPDPGQQLVPRPAAPATTAPVVPDGATHAGPRLAASPPVTSAGVQDAEPDTEQAGPSGTAPWLLTGLTGAGALLAGSLLVALRRRRRAAFRHRRPGRTLAAPDPVLSPVEKTITTIGSLTAPTTEHLDAVLRRLAAAAACDESPMPELAAVELTGTHLVLHLAAPAKLPTPWAGTGDHLHWQITAQVDLDQIGPQVPDQPAPYPLLVTIGLGEAGRVWLLNIEDLHVAITGDPVYGHDFARYLAAELACNPWSAGVEVTCLGLATELAALNPDRIHAHNPADAGADADPVGECLAETVRTIDAARDAGADVATARARQAGADPWPARLLLVDAATGTPAAGVDDPALEQLLELVHTHPGRTGTSVVIRGGDQRPEHPGTVLQVTADGRARLPAAGLDLVAVGLTSDEAQGCAALLAHGQTPTSAPVPLDQAATDGWRAWADQAGALRAEHTLPRNRADPTDPDDADDTSADGQAAGTSSLLEADDASYTQAAATTNADLQALAPRVPAAVRHEVEDADPTLEADLAMWLSDDCALPRLRLLGPVRATTRGKPLTRRKPYMTELLAYICLRPHGATPDELAQAFDITRPKARDYALTIRQWLGTNPRTGQPHLPDARLAPGAATRGVPVYQVIDLLVDIDLFRRLRVRGQARGGLAGIKDLRTALTLVQGRPFDYPLEREAGGGWAWLLDGDRPDEQMAVAIVDVAHTVTTHALAVGDLPAARIAAETAALAAPHEEIPRLDLAAVAAAEGHHGEAARIIREQVANRTDDDGPPPELPERTSEVLARRADWRGSKAG